MSSKQDLSSIVNVLRSINETLKEIVNLLTPVDSIQMRLGEIRDLLKKRQ